MGCVGGQQAETSWGELVNGIQPPGKIMLYHTMMKGKGGEGKKEREGKRTTTTMTILGYALFGVR